MRVVSMILISSWICIYVVLNTGKEVCINECSIVNGRYKYQNQLFTGKIIVPKGRGKKNLEIEVSDGVKHGRVVSYHNDGETISSISHYNQGKHIRTTYFDSSGNQRYDSD